MLFRKLDEKYFKALRKPEGYSICGKRPTMTKYRAHTRGWTKDLQNCSFTNNMQYNKMEKEKGKIEIVNAKMTRD